jgi:D-glycero-D-manno-heptose 1,7-bisphosphate phosphatase
MTRSETTVQGRFYEDLGIWIRATRNPAATPKPALFLDRDGVIIEDPGYLSCAADLVVVPGAAVLIASANRQGIPVIEVTNQAGIGRGYFGWKKFVEVEEALAQELVQEGAAIDAVFACPYHREGVAPWAHPEHPARKPQPGMLLAARQFLDVDLARSWIVGDRLGDLLAAYNAGLSGGLHVLTGKGLEHRESLQHWSPENFEVRFGNSIADASFLIDLLAV